MLIYTDIFIWYLRGRESAAVFLESSLNLQLSIITYMELVQGMRNKEELRLLRQTLGDWQAEILAIDERISYRAAHYVEQHYLSHNLRLADALIAATAVERGHSLATGNLKHYGMIDELELVAFRI